MVGGKNRVIDQITEAQLRESKILRNLVKEYKEMYFFLADNVKGSFEKQYTSKAQKELDQH